MNKRNRKKLDKKLIKAIKELNDLISVSEGLPEISEEDVLVILERVKKKNGAIQRVLKDHKLYESIG